MCLVSNIMAEWIENFPIEKREQKKIKKKT